jgi:hypothetical protein
MFLRVAKISESRRSVCHVSQSATEKLGFHWTAFHEGLCLSIFGKSVEKIQV